ncbi:hypothetical protein KST20_08700 [Fusobacterium animalis]
MMILEFDNYLFDKDKFLLSVLNGDVYKTQYIVSEVINNKGFLTISNKFNYKLSKEFIIDNLDILRDRGIVRVRIKKGD